MKAKKSQKKIKPKKETKTWHHKNSALIFLYKVSLKQLEPTFEMSLFW